MKGFDPKKFQGKPRVYTTVKGAKGVHRLWVWNELKSEYSVPVRGNIYEAFRYESINGKRKRTKSTFLTLEEAREWQAKRQSQVEHRNLEQQGMTGPKLGQIIQELKERTKDQYQSSTLDQYNTKLKHYFQELIPLSVYEITPQRVDRWIEDLKAPNGKGMERSTRLHFDHELDVLAIILGYYREYYDDPKFYYPIKKRHRKAAKLNRTPLAKRKDLTERELEQFSTALDQIPKGRLFAKMGVVQYWHALRVSEVAALHWEDVTLDQKVPENSILRVRRKVCYPRTKGSKPYVEAGFKNSKSNNGLKEHPLTPESYTALSSLFYEGASGLIFKTDSDEPIPYRTIQYYFNLGFKKAKLPFSATHVMRHGGCRAIYNSTDGNRHLAKELLGNSAIVETYAQSYKGNLKKWVKSRWEQHGKNKE